MNDDRLTQLLREADSYDASTARDLRGADLDLLEEITASGGTRRGSVRALRPRGLRRRLVTAGLAAAAVTAAIAAPTLTAHRSAEVSPGIASPSATPTGDRPAIKFAAADIRIARSNPRVLVTADGWKVRSVSGFGTSSGETTFQQGADQWGSSSLSVTGDQLPPGGPQSRINSAPQLTVSWYPADQYQAYLADRETRSGGQVVDVLGHRGQLVSYGADDHAALLPPQGPVFLELRGNVGNEAAFKRFLADDLAEVGVREWLAAMPTSVATAKNRDAAATAILADVPLPPGFDRGALGTATAEDSYQYGARVTGAVACGWIDEWSRARAAGDASARDRAVQALGTSRDWQVFETMSTEGDFPDSVHRYADLLAAGKAPTGYRAELGCAQR